MNKSFVTNLIAALIAVSGYFSPIYNEIILSVGLFALSGGVTNWVAIHMLFEKVPFLYGSGVVPNRFEEFKAGIKYLIIQEFFNKEHIEKFFSENKEILSADVISDKIDFDKVFEGLVEAIEGSSLGGMLALVGGKEALQPLKEPVIEKLKDIIADLAANSGAESGGDLTSVLIDKVEHIIDNRLEDLTPEMVKRIVQDMIKTHLGWLVVWGGVFGGLIGLLVSFL